MLFRRGWLQCTKAVNFVFQMKTLTFLCYFGVSSVNFLQALQRTLEFEDELAEKFGGGTQNREIANEIEEIGRGTNSSNSALDIRKKYEKKLAAHQGGDTEVCFINF